MASGFEKRIGSLGHSDVDDVGVGTYYGDGGEVDTGQSDEGFGDYFLDDWDEDAYALEVGADQAPISRPVASVEMNAERAAFPFVQSPRGSLPDDLYYHPRVFTQSPSQFDAARPTVDSEVNHSPVPSGEYSYDGSSSAHMPLRSVHEEQHVDQHQEYTRFSLHGAAPTLPSGIPEHPAQVNVSRFAHDPRSHRHLVSSPNESYWNSEGSYHIWPARSRTSPDSEHEEHPDYIKYSQFPGPQKYHSRTWQKPRTDQYCPTKRFREKYVLPRQSKCNQSSSRTYYDAVSQGTHQSYSYPMYEQYQGAYRPDYEAVGFPIPYRPPAQFVVPPVRGYVLAPAVQPGLYPHPYLPTQAMIPFGAPLPIMHQ